MIITSYEQLEPFRNKSGIYLFTDKLFPEKRYAGKSFRRLYKRIAVEHKNAYGARDNQWIDNIIKVHGLLERFIIELIHWYEDNEPHTNEELLAREVAVIDYYDCLIEKGGYNKLLFNFDRTGTKASPETMAKITDGRRKGKNNPRFGTKISVEQRKRQSETAIKNGKNKGKNHPQFNHAIYNFKNLKTNEEFEGTVYDFRIKYNIERRIVERLVHRQAKTIKKKTWTLANNSLEFLNSLPKDKTICTFKNTITNEIFIGIQRDFYKKYNLRSSDVYYVIKGKRKSVKNWILIK